VEPSHVPFVVDKHATGVCHEHGPIRSRPKGTGWAIETNGGIGGDYVTREAAFEAIVGEASNAIRNGEAVEIIVNKRTTATNEPR